MKTIAEMAAELRADRKTSCDEPQHRVARTRLIEAAKSAGIRVTLHREGDVLVAVALSDADGEAQRVRGVIFHAVNRIKAAVDALTAGSIDTEPISEEIEDLQDIHDELETYAKGYGT